MAGSKDVLGIVVDINEEQKKAGLTLNISSEAGWM